MKVTGCHHRDPDDWSICAMCGLEALEEAAKRPPPPTIQKVFDMVCSGVYDPPDAYDNLEQGIQFVTDCLRDPERPDEYGPNLTRWLIEALEVQRTTSGKVDRK